MRTKQSSYTKAKRRTGIRRRRHISLTGEESLLISTIATDYDFRKLSPSPDTVCDVHLPDCFEDHTAAARTAVQDLSRLGLSIVPIIPGLKHTPMKWKRYQHKAATVDQIQRWYEKYPGYNWGFVAGSVSENVMSVDVDSAAAFKFCEDQGGFIESQSVWFSTGRGRQYLYRLPPELADLPRSKPHDDLDFLTKGLAVLPPSIHHKTGKQYTWQSKPPTSLDDIPFAPQWVQDILTGQLEPQRRTDSIDSTNTPNPSTAASKPAKNRAQSTRRAVPENYPVNPGMTSQAGYRRLMTRTYNKGSRNSAATSLVSTLRLSGLSQEDTMNTLDQWRQDHTKPLYPASEAREVVKCVYENGYGLTVWGLQKSISSDGQRMPENEALALVQSMPSYRNRIRKNQPLFVSVGKILELLYDCRVFKPLALPHHELAEAAGITVDQVAKVAGFLTEIGVKGMRQAGSSMVSTYCLSSINVNNTTIIKQFTRWFGYKRHWKKLRYFLWKNFQRLMRDILRHLNDVWNLITATLLGETRQLAVVAVSGSDAGWLNRGPPS